MNSPASSRDPFLAESVDWIVPLAEPYLRGYTPFLESGDSLSGYRFLAPGFGASRRNPLHAPGVGRSGAPCPPGRASAGFFVGYLGQPSALPFLRSQAPECLVFCWAGPVGGAFHRRLVQSPESLMRRTAEYIRWLTHRPPRFELFPEERVVLVRHASMRDWPAGKLQHLSQNFFIETLCWLVRSALVRRLAAERGGKPAPAIAPPRAPAPRLAY